MADDIDFNDALDNIVLREEAERKESYQRGVKDGIEGGNPEGYHLGYHRGAELGRELGYYLGIVSYHLDHKTEENNSEKIVKQLEKVKKLINQFPRTNNDEDILGMADNIRANYKKACALLKIPSNNPFDTIFKMDTKISRVKNQLDTLISYLKPFLPLVNCHMVEFITENHWETYLPKSLRVYLDRCDLDDTVQQFWNVYSNPTSVTETTELTKWVNKARSHCVSANNDYCLTVPQLEDRITSMGGVLKPEIKVSQFMTSKKSYEVQVMSRLVAGLSSVAGCSHCVEVGGGRAPLPAALALGYNQPVLTVDCNEAAINTARQRIKVIQKQWHAIAKKLSNDTQDSPKTIDNNLNRFVSAFVTQETDLLGLVRQNFPESRQDTKLLLTGLHTCGNLGPDSLRLFIAHPYIKAIFNTPCCYHLLSEDTDVGCFDVFQNTYGSHRQDHGFPMSEHMRGYNLGRNARMLAAQSIDRVVDQRQLPCRSLLYRAMLQMVIKENPSQNNITEGKLKGLGRKCQHFREYFKMADALLKLDVYDSLPDSYFAHIQQSESCQWKKIVLFYLMRLCLAQVVESVILLDRLLYMCENGFKNVYLVKLFDPVLSPRCHSIVAKR